MHQQQHAVKYFSPGIRCAHAATTGKPHQQHTELPRHAVRPAAPAAASADQVITLTVKVENKGNVNVQGIAVTLAGATATTTPAPTEVAKGAAITVSFQYKLTLADLEARSKIFAPSASGNWIPLHAGQIASTPNIAAEVTATPRTFIFDSRRSLSLHQALDSSVFSETGTCSRLVCTQQAACCEVSLVDTA